MAVLMFNRLLSSDHRKDLQPCKQWAEHCRLKKLFSIGVWDGSIVTFSGPSKISVSVNIFFEYQFKWFRNIENSCNRKVNILIQTLFESIQQLNLENIYNTIYHSFVKCFLYN